MRSHNVLLGVFASLSAGGFGCMPSLQDLDQGPLTETFAVSDYYTPSGYMGDGKHFGLLTGKTNEGCRPRPDGARGNCYVFTYYPNALDEEAWAGVYWVFPANSWGSTGGHAIDAAKFKQVRFYAAVETAMPFTYDGGIQGNFSARAGGIREGATYPDGVLAVSSGGAVGNDVTGELKQFHIPLTEDVKKAGCVEQPPPPDPPVPENCTKTIGADGQEIKVANDLVGGFAWSLPYPTDTVSCRDGTAACREGRRHSSQYLAPAPVRIYIDDIVWDTEPAP